MNFFERQDQARRSTTRLVVLFILAVIGTVAAMNAAAYGILHLATDLQLNRRSHRSYYLPPVVQNLQPLWQRWDLYAGVSAVTLLIIGGGSAYKTAALSGGGRSVAELMGGRPLDQNSTDEHEHIL